jgi:hypothetical protein
VVYLCIHELGQFSLLPSLKVAAHAYVAPLRNNIDYLRCHILKPTTVIVVADTIFLIVGMLVVFPHHKRASVCSCTDPRVIQTQCVVCYAGLLGTVIRSSILFNSVQYSFCSFMTVNTIWDLFCWSGRNWNLKMKN